MRIIAYRTSEVASEVLLEESTGESVTSKDIDDLFGFLLEDYDKTIRVCWDLNQTVSLLLRLLNTKSLETLQKTRRCKIPPYSIFYIPDKVFSLIHIPSNLKINLYDLQQYFPELPEPADILELQMLGEKLMKELAKMRLAPTKLSSPIAIYKECMLDHLDLPELSHIAPEVSDMAYRCSGKLWIEAHQLGYWDKVWDYDLSSAFPNIAKDLIDYRQCKVYKTSKYLDYAVYGYVNATVTIYDWVMVSPILFEDDNGIYSFTGTKDMILPKSWLDFITTWKIGEYKINNGYWLVPTTKEPSKPLYNPVTSLLRYKNRTDRTVTQTLLAKRMATGIYGSMGEEHEDDFAKYANFIWFAEISSRCPLQVAEFLYTHGIGAGDNEGYKTLLQVGVDGVMLSEPVEGELDGNWKLAYENDALIISSGLVYTRNTKPKGLRLHDILDMIEKNPNSNYYQKGVPRRVTMGDALSKNKPELIGKPMTFNSSINLIHPEHDRVFDDLPANGRDLLNNKYRSRPISL